MNASSYKTVFSKRLGALVAVGEHATSQGKANGASGPGASGASEGAASALAGIGYVAALSASFAFVSLAWAAPATNALPSGGTVVHGTASMSQNASQLNITQGSQRAAINWQSFDIGANAKVNVVQPNAQAVLLNRVVGQSPSQIFGQLQANGHVILVNPNGVLFGKDGSVNAGGFTASTLNISDANFMAGNMVYERNGSTAGIVNQGSITAAPGGYVALLGATVSNEGSITTKGGSMVMGAGETIKVPVSGTGRIKLELTPAAINASLSNTGSIVTEGGQVYMQALALNRAAAQILQSGSIDTTGEKGGDVHLLADGGQIRVSGSIRANSTNGTAGGDIYIGRDKDTNVLATVGDVSGARIESKGGFVETSGKFLATYGTRVKAKDWLLDPFNITIASSASVTTYNDPNSTGGSYEYTPDADSIIRASDIAESLKDGTSVKISTGLAGSAGSSAGNITVAATITKDSGTEATLELEANNGIRFINGAKIIGNSVDGALHVKLNAGGSAKKADGNDDGANSFGVHLGENTGIETNGAVTVNSTTKFTNGWDFTRSALAMQHGSVIKGSNVQINLKVYLPTQNRVFGLFAQNNTRIEATKGNVAINAEVKNAGMLGGHNSGAIQIGSSFGKQVVIKASGEVPEMGNISISSDTTDRSNLNTTGNIGIVDTVLDASGKITIDAKVQNPSMWAVGIGKGPDLGSTLKAGGNIEILSNQGSIGVTTSIANAVDAGGNITINNSGTNNDGTSSRTDMAGVHLAGFAGVGIKAGGNIDIKGKSTSSAATAGVNVNTGLEAEKIKIVGESVNGNGVFIAPPVTIKANDSMTIEGTSTGTNSNSAGLSLWGKVEAVNDIKLTGKNTHSNNAQSAVFVTNQIKSNNGSIEVNAIHQGTGTGVQLHTHGTSPNQLVGQLEATNGNVTIRTDSINLENAGGVSAVNGSVTIANQSSGTTIHIGSSDVMTAGNRVLGISNNELNKISAKQTVIGSSTAGSIAVSNISSLAATGDLTLQTGGDIAVNAALNVGPDADRKNLTFNAAGINSKITQNADGVIRANKVHITGADAEVSLAAAVNQIKQLTAKVKSLDFKNGNALQIGADATGITASGRIKVETTTGNLSLDQAVTSSAQNDPDAVTLIADENKNAGETEGGNIIKGSNGSVILGYGSTAKLYTGSISGGTDMQVLAGGAGSGHYRYNSDEATTNFSKALEAGVNIIYREAPEVTVKVSDVNKIYDGVAHSGGSFSSASTAVGLKNGDTDAWVGSNAVFSGNAQGVKDVLASVGKTISASDNGQNALGYKVTYTEGTLSITPRPLTIAPGSVATKTADGTTAATVTPGALSNLVGTETLAVAATGTFSDANAGNNKAVNAFYTLQNGGNGGLASNYILALGKPGNPDTRMTGTILAAVNPVTPIAPVNNNTGSVSRVSTVSGFGGAGAATGVLDDKAVTESREVCSDVFPENCECQPSVIPSIEICFAPKSVAATKEEK